MFIKLDGPAFIEYSAFIRDKLIAIKKNERNYFT